MSGYLCPFLEPACLLSGRGPQAGPHCTDADLWTRLAVCPCHKSIGRGRWPLLSCRVSDTVRQSPSTTIFTHLLTSQDSWPRLYSYPTRTTTFKEFLCSKKNLTWPKYVLNIDRNDYCLIIGIILQFPGSLMTSRTWTASPTRSSAMAQSWTLITL